MSNTLAKGFATLFDGFANDADPYGHTPVKNEFLTDCAAELRRLDGYASSVKAGGVVAAVIKDGEPQWVKNQPALSNGTLLYAIPPDHAAILRQAMDALRNAVGGYVSDLFDIDQEPGPTHEIHACKAAYAKVKSILETPNAS